MFKVALVDDTQTINTLLIQIRNNGYDPLFNFQGNHGLNGTIELHGPKGPKHRIYVYIIMHEVEGNASMIIYTPPKK